MLKIKGDEFLDQLRIALGDFVEAVEVDWQGVFRVGRKGLGGDGELDRRRGGKGGWWFPEIESGL